MKRIALFAVAGLVLAACSAKEEAPKADSAAAAPAAAPAAMPAMDTTKKDSAAAPAAAAPAKDSVKH
jgi:PBP1b-binding outer membrane lipoprotein LpoB